MPTPPLQIDERYLDYATPRQREILEAVIATGSATGADAMLKLHKGAASEVYKSVKARATHRGFSPDHDMTRPVPEGYKVKGVSTYYNLKTGKPTGQWVKSNIDDEAREKMIRAFVETLCEQQGGLAPIIPAPANCDDDYLAVYPLGDPHFGMFAWGEEAGDDFDLKTADSLTRGAIDRLVSSTPPCGRALLLNLGDFFHADDAKNATPGHGHALDVDTRYGKVMRVGLAAMVHCTLRILERHAHVTVKSMAGNHDPHSSFALALAMQAWFRNEPRVTVDIGSSLFYYYRFGNVLIGSHHGHGAKAGDLPAIMATDRPRDWGETEHRVWHCGHIHHKTLAAKDHTGCEVETHRTLAASDAWHAGKGYRARRDAKAIVYHREHGEDIRVRCDVSRLRLAA